jgi:hypothetical protein
MEQFTVGTRVIVNGQVDEIYIENQAGVIMKDVDKLDKLSRPLIRFDNKFHERLHDGGYSGDWGNHWFCDVDKVRLCNDEYMVDL